MTSISERVARGAAWLDSNWPLWLRQVDLDRLDLTSACRCVLGQTMGHFDLRPDELEDAAFYGFSADNWVTYELLETEWRRVITSRREATPDGR